MQTAVFNACMLAWLSCQWACIPGEEPNTNMQISFETAGWLEDAATAKQLPEVQACMGMQSEIQ